MAKKKKAKEKKLEVQTSLPPAPPQDPQIPLDVYFSLKKIKQHWQAGMKAYKNANEECPKSKKDWERFFDAY